MSPRPAPLTRRGFLLGSGAAAGVVLLGACGSDEAGDDTTTTVSAGDDLALVQFFGGAPMLAAGAEVRAPFGIADADDLLPTDQTPASLTVTVLGPDGESLGTPIEVPRHAAGLPRAYYPLRFTPSEAGIYTGRTEIDGRGLEMAIKVDDPGDVPVIQVGDALPPIVTPTADDAHGVEPMCTNDPVCALHDVTVAQALDEGRPIALLVATPAFCQITICGPVLDVLLAVTDQHPDVHALHAEVYVQPQQDLDVKTPAVDELGLTFEPCLVLVGSDGRVAERLDTIFDEVEVGEALARLT